MQPGCKKNRLGLLQLGCIFFAVPLQQNKQKIGIWHIIITTTNAVTNIIMSIIMSTNIIMSIITSMSIIMRDR